MKLRTLILGTAFALLLFPALHCQSDSMIHVTQFPGVTVGDKVANAQKMCPAAPVPCILVIDASLAAAANGTMPTLCATCYLYDFRFGPPQTAALNASTFAGVDIFDKANAAFASCAGICTVAIPAGTYNNVTTTLDLPGNLNGTAGLEILGTVNYTGTGDAIYEFGSNDNQNIYIYGPGKIVGTASGKAGLHLKVTNRVSIFGLNISGFSAGDGFFSEGANTVDCYSCNFSDDKNGVHLGNAIVSAVNYSSNAIHFYGGDLKRFSTYGIWEDATVAGPLPNQGNIFHGMVFENTIAGARSFYLQQSERDLIEGNYIEGTAAVTDEILLGDSTHQAKETTVENNNFIASAGSTTNDIDAVNAPGMRVVGNSEIGAPTNFLNLGASTTHADCGLNLATGATNYKTGTGSCDFEVDFFGVVRANNSYNINSTQVIDPSGNVLAGGGSTTVYRCTVAGALPVGALTTNTANCGASGTADSGLRVK